MLSHGPFNYNRFSVLDEKKAKPDFLDMDKDGNKKESMKKAIKDKECDDCGKKDCGCDDKKKSGKKELPDFIKKNMKEDQEVIALEFDDAADWLIENGICKDESGCEVWLEHASPQTLDALAAQIQEKAGCGYQKGGVVKAKPGKKMVKEGKLDEIAPAIFGMAAGKMMDKKMKGGDKKDDKKKIVKEDVIAHLIENNYVNNEVSAEAMFNHISDAFLESIEEDIMEGFMPLPAGKMAKQSGKAYGKEQDAVKKGDEAGANKQMQRRIAMQNPAGRKAQLQKK